MGRSDNRSVKGRAEGGCYRGFFGLPHCVIILRVLKLSSAETGLDHGFLFRLLGIGDEGELSL